METKKTQTLQARRKISLSLNTSCISESKPAKAVVSSKFNLATIDIEMDNFINSCIKNNIDIVSFDFDSTMTRIHTAKDRGENGLELNSLNVDTVYKNLDASSKAFLDNDVKFWQLLTQKLHDAGIKLIVCSKQDEKTISTILNFHNIQVSDIFGGDSLNTHISNLSPDLRKYNLLSKYDILNNQKKHKVLHFDDSQDEVDNINLQNNTNLFAFKTEPNLFIEQFCEKEFIKSVTAVMEKQKERLVQFKLSDVSEELNSSFGFFKT